MEITLKSSWHRFVKDGVMLGHRIEIAGYSAAVEAQQGVYVFTVLKDHFTIVEVGQRDTLVLAKQAAEIVIQDDIELPKEN